MTTHQVTGPRVQGKLAACGRYTTTPALRCSAVLPVYSTNPPPDVDTEISESPVAGAATAPSEPTTLTTVRFFFFSLPTSSAAAAGGAGLPARRQQQEQGALRKNSNARMNATATRPSASAAANMSGWYR